MRTILIKYEWWAYNFKDRWWTGIFEDTGEVYDYNTKNELKRLATAEGFSWKVLRHHRNGKISVVEQSADLSPGEIMLRALREIEQAIEKNKTDPNYHDGQAIIHINGILQNVFSRIV